MPGKARKIVLRTLITKIVEQQKGIEISSFAKAEGALQLYAGALESGSGLQNLFDGSERHDFSFPSYTVRLAQPGSK
jgi:hypothetical protein